MMICRRSVERLFVQVVRQLRLRDFEQLRGLRLTRCTARCSAAACTGAGFAPGLALVALALPASFVRPQLRLAPSGAGGLSVAGGCRAAPVARVAAAVLHGGGGRSGGAAAAAWLPPDRCGCLIDRRAARRDCRSTRRARRRSRRSRRRRRRRPRSTASSRRCESPRMDRAAADSRPSGPATVGALPMPDVPPIVVAAPDGMTTVAASASIAVPLNAGVMPWPRSRITPQPFQIGAEIGGGLIPHAAILLERLRDDAIELRRQHRVDGAGRHRIAIQDAVEHHGGGVARENSGGRWPSRTARRRTKTDRCADRLHRRAPARATCRRWCRPWCRRRS